MVRFRSIFVASPIALALGLAVVAASAQTVADYQKSLGEAQVLNAVPAKADQVCQPLANFAAASLADSDAGLFNFDFVGLSSAPADDDLASKRQACIDATSQAHRVVFDDKSGTPLLSPIKMEDPNKAYMAPNPQTPGGGLYNSPMTAPSALPPTP